MTLENEIELIKGCRAGKDSARKELYTLYSKQMLAVCFRYTGDMDAAHDVLHDGFIKIFTNFSFRGESSLCTWTVSYTHLDTDISYNVLKVKDI